VIAERGIELRLADVAPRADRIGDDVQIYHSRTIPEPPRDVKSRMRSQAGPDMKKGGPAGPPCHTDPRMALFI
jgi:hypothetical protein